MHEKGSLIHHKGHKSTKNHEAADDLNPCFVFLCVLCVLCGEKIQANWYSGHCSISCSAFRKLSAAVRRTSSRDTGSKSACRIRSRKASATFAGGTPHRSAHDKGSYGFRPSSELPQ